ncbi:MAG: PP2C family protein-serine/threonine phosphatase [Bryobacteraceae bacterium]
MGNSSEPPHLRIHAINIYVRDQERSLRFYVEQLGFKLTFDARLGSRGRWLAVSPPDGSAVLVLIAPKRGSQEYKFIGRATHVAFLTEDVLAKFHEWRSRGVRFTHTPRLRRLRYDRPAEAAAPAGEDPIWGGVFARFQDVDGNRFALMGFDTASRELEAQRQALAARLEAERRAAQELEIARQVQARLFPQELPPLKTLEYAGICIQARQVGGDYYDFLSLGRGRLGLVIGDIAGKGIAAALLMANLQANLRSQCAMALARPQRFLESVNRLFFENTVSSAYATLFFAEYDDRSGRLRYANCGHLSGLVLRRGGHLERLDSTCTVLGLFADWNCALCECRLAAGDALALYTDGVTEAFNGAGEDFGEQRLVEALRRTRKLTCHEQVEAIAGEVRQFSPGEQFDDITLIVARRREG